MKYWSKSALLIYKYLEKMTNTVDKLIMDIGKHSNSHVMQKNQTTYGQASKIIEYLDRKRKMINLKVAVEESLAKLNRTDRRILALVFIDGVKSDMVAQFLGVSLRTFFRKKIEALANFNTQMIANGFDLNFFNNEYACEKWILAVYNECLSKSLTEDENINFVVVKRLMNEISQVKINSNCYGC